MAYQRLRNAVLAGAALTLGACGGGGGGGTNFIPSPPVTPAPEPPPPPPPPPPPVPSTANVFPGLTQSTQFAATGYESGGSSGNDMSVRYDASTGDYIFDLPSAEPGRFSPQYPQYNGWSGAIVDSSGTASTSMTIRDPAALELTYTTFARYSPTNGYAPSGYVAFGSATPEGAVPVTGSASYSATLSGGSTGGLVVLGGTAALNFDFAAGTLSGSLDASLAGEWNGAGPYHFDFGNAVFSTGSTSFSGQLSSTSVDGLGSFDGRFTGPNAQELMGRWQIPYVDWWGNGGSAIGVFVGHKQ